MSITTMMRATSFSRPAAEISPDDNPESLAEKIHKLEYSFYPEIIERLIMENAD